QAALPREAGPERRQPAAHVLRAGRRGAADGLRLELRGPSLMRRLIPGFLAALALAAPAAAAASIQVKGLDTTGYPTIRLGVVTFGSTPVQLTTLTASPIDAQGALRDVAVDSHQGTALYDAIVLSAQALDQEEYPGRVIIVLTDGRDVSSKATLKGAVEAARKAGAAVYPIGIVGKGFSPGPLQRIAR